ncbi:hypothetical protein [Candidatus Merdisoma sp. JLR.KK006]|uniref:hypothetical protein n=1 Tax=Candidatus Merdisoma sp. JLR.KK006 TaxID=3112626 RepID=UPI002FEF46C6
MQGRTVLGGMDLKAYLNRLRQNPKYSEEILQLIEDDLRFGLSKEEVEEYSGGRYDYRQMCVYSRVLRDGYGKEVKALILKEGLSGEQMAVALEFYEKGVPVDTIDEILSNGENTAYTMKRLFSQVLSQSKETQSIREQDMGYAKELVEQMQRVVEQISYQEKRYDALNEKLKEIGTASQDAQIQNNLLAQLTEKNGLLEKQQDELNEAKTAIARLRGKIEEMEKEKKRLENQIKKAEHAETAEMTEPENLEEESSVKIPWESHVPDVSESPRDLGTEYYTAIVDKDGRVIRHIPLERTERRDRKNRMTAIFTRLFFKQRKDIVKLLADKNLSPDQLVQIRNAIEKGLTEKQLLVLINNRIPAEQMEEIISIAVYENQIKEVQSWG